MDTIETLEPLERLAVLQSVPLFAELGTDDLERIAAVTSERRYDPAELVFARGDLGDEMLVIVEGSVDVTSGGREGRVIATLGVGEHVGELAVLRRLPRMADVFVGDGGMLGLVIDAATLESILHERPGIALSMLATLADRLAAASVLPAR